MQRSLAVSDEELRQAAQTLEAAAERQRMSAPPSRRRARRPRRADERLTPADARPGGRVRRQLGFRSIDAASMRKKVGAGVRFLDALAFTLSFAARVDGARSAKGGLRREGRTGEQGQLGIARRVRPAAEH